jgi:hypothetical protein
MDATKKTVRRGVIAVLVIIAAGFLVSGYMYVASSEARSTSRTLDEAAASGEMPAPPPFINPPEDWLGSTCGGRAELKSNEGSIPEVWLEQLPWGDFKVTVYADGTYMSEPIPNATPVPPCGG